MTIHSHVRSAKVEHGGCGCWVHSRVEQKDLEHALVQVHGGRHGVGDGQEKLIGRNASDYSQRAY